MTAEQAMRHLTPEQQYALKGEAAFYAYIEVLEAMKLGECQHCGFHLYPDSYAWHHGWLCQNCVFEDPFIWNGEEGITYAI